MQEDKLRGLLKSEGSEEWSGKQKGRHMSLVTYYIVVSKCSKEEKSGLPPWKKKGTAGDTRED